MPPPVSLLLDKDVVRHLLVGLDRELAGRTPAVDRQRTALTLFRQIAKRSVSTQIARETWNILARRHSVTVVNLFLPHVSPLDRGRYFRRWARRLTEHGFTYEDAKTLSNACFGVDRAGERLGVDLVVTCDERMLHNYQTHFPVLSVRLDRMARQLPLPYRNVGLPEVLTLDQAVSRLMAA